MAGATLQNLTRSALQTYVRRFPVSKGKQRLIDLSCRLLAPGRERLVTKLRQAEVQVLCDLTQHIQRQIYFWGSYEPEACDLWVQCARSAQTVVDVGANVGVYSLLAAATNPRAHVHAFEPTPGIADIFRENIHLNKLTNIAVNVSGVGKENGHALLRQCRGVDGANEGMNFTVGATEPELESDLRVPLVTLTEYCDRRGIGQIDLLKMDIEGGEYDALSGAAGLLRSQAVKCIFFELVEWSARRGGHSTADIKRLLTEFGYKLYEVRAGGLKPLPTEGADNIACAVALSSGYRLHGNHDN
jgi:FkbM family methyltransferase